MEGMVHRPAIYELNGEKTLNQVLELAGGVLSTASLKQINVARIVAHERHTMLSLQLPDNPAEVAEKLAELPGAGRRRRCHFADFALQPRRGLPRRTCLSAWRVSLQRRDDD